MLLLLILFILYISMFLFLSSLKHDICVDFCLSEFYVVLVFNVKRVACEERSFNWCSFNRIRLFVESFWFRFMRRKWAAKQLNLEKNDQMKPKFYNWNLKKTRLKPYPPSGNPISLCSLKKHFHSFILIYINYNGWLFCIRSSCFTHVIFFSTHLYHVYSTVRRKVPLPYKTQTNDSLS